MYQDQARLRLCCLLLRPKGALQCTDASDGTVSLISTTCPARWLMQCDLVIPATPGVTQVYVFFPQELYAIDEKPHRFALFTSPCGY